MRDSRRRGVCQLKAVSVIIPAHNAAATIARTLASLRSEADVIGGGSRSRFWLSVLANVLNVPIHRFADGETGAAFGAARLGRLAVTGEAIEAVCTPPQRVETFDPDRVLVQAYAERLPAWRQLYRPRH